MKYTDDSSLTKVENFRTQEFRSKIEHIKTSRHSEEELSHKRNSKTKYNFNQRCEIKPIYINKVLTNDCVCYYYTLNDNNFKLQTITLSDLETLERELKLSNVVGEKIEVKKFKNKRKDYGDNRFELNVGSIYSTSNLCDCNEPGFIKIIRKTPKQYEYVYCTYSHTRENVKSMNEQTFYFEIEYDEKNIKVGSNLRGDKKSMLKFSSHSWSDGYMFVRDEMRNGDKLEFNKWMR